MKATLGAVSFLWFLVDSVKVYAQGSEGSFASSPLVSLAALAILTLLPFAFMTATSFVKISVVLSVLRNALGTGQVPSGTIITSLSVILSLYVMLPVGQEILDVSGADAVQVSLEQPLSEESQPHLVAAIEAGLVPLKAFLRRNAGEREVALFYELAVHQSRADDRENIEPSDLMVVLPSFLITELSEAFQIAFLVFVPFLIIDMVVANILLALGMHMLSPTTVSLPFKLLLFVLVEGWYLLARALVLGYV